MAKDSPKVHPAAGDFPMMDKVALKELSDNIKANGQQFPITFWKKDGSLLDGRNRHAACLMAGIPPKTDLYEGDDPVGFILAANIHRRHLTPAEKRDLIDKLIKRYPEKSNHQLARDIKAGPNTVARRRAKAEAKGDVVQRTTVVDSKGRKQPTKKSRKLKASPALVPTGSADVPVEERRAQMAALDRPKIDALVQFKVACNIWVAQMSRDQIKEAIAYLQQRADAIAPPQPQNGAAVGSA
jgi:hypothetical protein